MGERDLRRPSAAKEWWEAPNAPRTYFALEQDLVERLTDAVVRFGYARAPEAEVAMGPETWAAVQRYGRDWVSVCVRSTEEHLAELASAIARHLIQIRNGNGFRLVGNTLGAILTDKTQPLSKEGRDVARMVGIDIGMPSDLISGRDLAWCLAEILDGDIDMTPVREVARMAKKKPDVVRITQELLSTWKQNGDFSRAGKQMFRRTLIKRLEESG